MMREAQDRLRTKPSQQLTAAHLRRLIWCCIVAIWGPLLSVPAVAAILPDAGITDPLNVSPVLIIVASFISTLTGATALLIRIDRELSGAPDKALPHPWIMCASHMLGAWLAGLLAFILCRQHDFAVWNTLGTVLIASYGNAKVVEGALERWLPNRFSSTGKDSLNDQTA